jgi:methylmalonyl-CoA mutase C-terminal domain/subunit
LKEKGIEDVILTGGGIIPEEDMVKLIKMGVDKLFGPGTPLEEIVEYYKEAGKRRISSVV